MQEFDWDLEGMEKLKEMFGPNILVNALLNVMGILWVKESPRGN